MDVLYWLFAAILWCIYFGYASLLLLMSRFRNDGVGEVDMLDTSVSLIIAAYNEEEVIAGKLENSLQLDYPQDKLEIIVFSDASSDATDEIVQSYAHKGLKLMRIEGRKGKTHCQNEAVEKSKGEIIVFSDANSIYEPDAISRLVERFSDPRIGCVSGELRYRKADGGVEGERVYWRYEQLIKRMESRVSSSVGANGSIYALRKAMYIPLRSDATSDFVEPLLLVRERYRVVHESHAVAWEDTAPHSDNEFSRRVRMVSRMVHCLFRYPVISSLLNPLRYRFFSVQLWTHRVLRWLTGAWLLALLILNVLLARQSRVYLGLLTGQAVFYTAALTGFLVGRIGHARVPRLLHVPYYFCASCVAMLLGFARGMLGRAPVVWETQRVKAEGKGRAR